MAKLRNGLLGKASGKVGGLVTANWKGINYAREYVIPANPRSSAQTTRRTVFSHLIFIGRQIKSTFIDTFWNTLYKGKNTTGFAQFTGYNQKNISELARLADLKLATGDLENVQMDEIAIDSLNNRVDVAWFKNTVSNGSGSDKVFIYVYVPSRKFLYSQPTSYSRDDEAGSISVPDIGEVLTDIYVFVTTCNATGDHFSTTFGHYGAL